MPSSAETSGQAGDFAELGVAAGLAAALAPQGISTPTPIQKATLPDSLTGRDVLGRGRTGSGKTYAFLLPLASRLQGGRHATARRPRSLILAPTRELALQIEESFAPLSAATGLSSQTVFGGVGQNPQVKALARGVDVLVACPGRLLDLMGQGHVDLSAVEVLVIDEADHMADMGFLPMVRRILDKVSTTAQKMLFSATLDEGVGVLVQKYLKNPVVHEADSAVSPVSKMDHHVVSVDGEDKLVTLANLCAAPGRTIVFTRTKYGAKKAAKQLRQRGVSALELHGNLSQNARTRNLDAFHNGTAGTLVATDIAARGIHVDDVSLVIHSDPPTEHKAYLHRSGRTARAGQAGTVVTLASRDQRNEVRTLMRAAKISPTVHADGADNALLETLAPGERTFLETAELEKLLAVSTPSAQSNQGGQGNQGGRNGRQGQQRGQQRGQQQSRQRGQGGGQASQGGGQRGQHRGQSGQGEQGGATNGGAHGNRGAGSGGNGAGRSGAGRPGNRRAGSSAGAPTSGGRVYTSETGQRPSDNQSGRDDVSASRGGESGRAGGSGRSRGGRGRRQPSRSTRS
ncbi:DEAD/DEAH box helicase [Citricoccus sp. GCM10030269]|uniref:DEAD/DEAH box helicase n=1 Tax=Citricoccus sp. GCM10030269 TaxID=3273388 RepID=UPI00360A4245